MKTANNKVTQIEVRGGNVHNLKILTSISH